MRLIRLILILFVSSILIRCAQPRNVTGGPKDTNPPVVLQSIPKNFTTHFSGQSIMMEFDEYVKVVSLNNELVVSPPLKYPVEYRIKGKKVFFDIQDTLLPSTTYNFNFGNAIVDLNESNPLDSNLYVFSTGDYIDSGFVSGIVRDAYTLNPIKSATVMLFSSVEDSAIYNGGPTYIAKTNDQGRYRLQYLQNVDYQIFALQSPGSEYNYRPYGKVGFNSEDVNPISTDTVDFLLFQEHDTSQFVTKDFSSDYFSFHVGFFNDLVNPEFSFDPEIDTVDFVIEEIQPDSFEFWIEGDLDIDSVYLYVKDESGYADTVGVDLDDRTKYFKKLKRKKQTKNPVKMSLNVTGGTFNYFDSLSLKLNRPLSKWNSDSVLFIVGKDTMSADSLMRAQKLFMEIPIGKRGTTKELRYFPVKYDWKPQQNYGFVFYPGAFTDVIGNTNDTSQLTFKTLSFEDYGSFRMTVKVPDYSGPLLLELMNKDGKFLRDYKLQSGDVIYHELAVPGKYQMRLIIDENGNNKWDTGELDTKTQAETIVYYQGEIEIRPNWDMEETWVVNFE